MEYLLKASAITAIFYGFYKLILQRETFFQSNRLFLLIGIITIVFVPLIVIPIYVEQPAFFTQSFSSSISNDVIIQQESIDWMLILKYIYLGGILFFGGKFIFNLISLRKLISSHPKEKNGNYNFIKTDKNTSPFSFFSFIVFNPNQFENKELVQIITHEKVHVKQLHSIDILISQVVSIAFWFNPFIWMYKKEIQQNLEFIADDLAQQKSVSEKSYQQLLLKSSLPKNQLALTNDFYNSLIKKRIIMLHKNRSKSTNQWKYALILPLIIAFIFAFNTETIAQTKATEIEEVVEQDTENDNLTFSITITKDSNTESLNKFTKMFNKDFLQKELGEISLKFNGIKRNKKNEIIAIKISASSKTTKADYSTSSNKPIKSIKITVGDKGNDISISKAIEKLKIITESGNNSILKGDGFIFITENEGNKNNTTITTRIEKIIYEEGDSIRFNSTIKKDILYYIDGKKSNKKDLDKLSSSDIKNISVLKGKAATEKYGKIAENGVIFISTSPKKNSSSTTVTIKESSGKENSRFITDLDGDLLYYINGEKSNKEDLDKLSSNSIDSISILKGKAATKVYGKKAKDGVILITTKSKR